MKITIKNILVTLFFALIVGASAYYVVTTPDYVNVVATIQEEEPEENAPTVDVPEDILNNDNEWTGNY